MKISLLITFCFLYYCTFSQYHISEYDSVVFYTIDKIDELAPEIKLFSPTGDINSAKDGVTLTDNQLAELLDIINDSLTYGQRHSYSHETNYGFVCYNGDKISNWIEIGFNTNTLFSNNPIEAQNKYYEHFLGDSSVEYDLNGLSTIGRKKLKVLIEQLDQIDFNMFLNQWDSLKLDHSELNKRF